MRHSFRNYLFVAIIQICVSILFPRTIFAATTVSSLSQNATNVGKYTKFELTFPISRMYPESSFLPYYFYDATDTPSQYPGRNSPYGVDGISIDAVFTSPSGKMLTVPAFYFQNFNRSGDTMTPTANYSWKVRFSPSETGTYNYYLTVQDKSGTSRYPTSGSLQFQSVQSTSKGFLRVSPRDSRFMEFDNGESFILISSGKQWWRNNKRTTYYETSFDEFKQYGINFTRIWDQNDSFGLTVEGHYDGYTYPTDFKPTDAQAIANLKGTQMNQRGNFEEDVMLQSAEKNGIYIELCSHADPYWIWDASIHNEGWNPNPVAMDNLQHINYWKRNYRYRIARWGYSTSIAAWEIWNEHGHILNGSETWNFYSILEQYIKDTDSNHHLRTTSQGSQAWSPAFWSSSSMDIANYHDYMMSSRYSSPFVYDTAWFVYKFAQCFRAPNGTSCGLGIGDGSVSSGSSKPYIWGEFDSGSATWDQPYSQATPKVYHDGKWAGLFSPIGTSPIDWYYDQQTAAVLTTRNQEARIVSDFFKDIDYSGKKFTYLSTSDVQLISEPVSTTNSNFRVLAMRAQSNAEAYAWVQNKNNSRWDQPANTSAASGTFTISGMVNGTYTVELWDTYTGTKNSSTVQVSNGTVTIPVNNLTKDFAFKIRTGQSSVSPTLQKKLGDGNGDGNVNGLDYIVWLTNFGITTTLGTSKGDYNNDTKVNGLDYVVWLTNFGK